MTLHEKIVELLLDYGVGDDYTPSGQANLLDDMAECLVELIEDEEWGSA